MTVLHNEIGAAECGGFDVRFEVLSTEPPRGVVDPMPEAWRQIAALLGRLASDSRPTSTWLAKLLDDTRADALHFASMAERQMRSEPLTEDEYALISRFAGVIEHPIGLFDGSVHVTPSEAGVGVPTPLPKIVPILSAAPGTYWSVALGRPRKVTIILHDRGQRSAAVGAWYSYFEAIGPRANDDEWRGVLDKVRRPVWVTVDEAP